VARRLNTHPDFGTRGTGDFVFLHFKPTLSVSTKLAFVEALQPAEFSSPTHFSPPTEKPPAFLTENLRFSLGWEARRGLSFLAATLRAQWAKNLNTDVELLNDSPSSALLFLKVQHPDPFSAAPSEKDPLSHFLFEQTAPFLKSPHLKPLPTNPIGDWDFARIEWS
jgi:hypothetical protein